MHVIRSMAIAEDVISGSTVEGIRSISAVTPHRPRLLRRDFVRVATADPVITFAGLDHLEIGDAVVTDLGSAGIGSDHVNDHRHQRCRIVQRVRARAAIIGVGGPHQGRRSLRHRPSPPETASSPEPPANVIIAARRPTGVIAASTVDQIIAAIAMDRFIRVTSRIWSSPAPASKNFKA